MKETSFFIKYKSIIAFLLIEVLALVSFTFANINEVFYLITAGLSLIAFLFAFKLNADKKDFFKLIPAVVLLFIISGIAAFGGFSHSFSLLSNIATFFALPAFFSLGFFAKRIDEIKIEYILFAIGFGLAALVLISTFATWIQYGFFYTAIYKARGTTIYYYNGITYNITKEMNWLFGFKINEASLEYGGLFSVMCGAFLPALLVIDIKEHRNYFICSAVIGSVGLISILTILNIKALVILLLASLFTFAYKFIRNKKKLVNGIVIGLLVLLSLAVIVYFMMIINAAVGFKFTGFMEKLFVSNRFIRNSSSVLSGAFAKDLNGTLYNLFGFNLSNQAAPIINLQAIVLKNTGIFEFEIIKELGVIGMVFLLIFLIAMVLFVMKYLRDSKDSSMTKNIIIVMLLAFFMFSTIGCDILPQTHNQNNYSAFLRSVPFMLSLFLLGLIYFSPNQQGQNKGETNV